MFDVRRTQPKLNAKEAWGRAIRQKEIRLLVGRSSAGRIWKYAKDLSATSDFSFPDLEPVVSLGRMAPPRNTCYNCDRKIAISLWRVTYLKATTGKPQCRLKVIF